MYPRCAPQGICMRHPSDQLPDLTVFSWPTGTAAAGEPRPVRREALPMPSDDGFGFDDDECFLPVGPVSGEDKPKASIGSPKPGPPVTSIEDSELLTKREVLKRQLGSLFEGGWDQREQAKDDLGHGQEGWDSLGAKSIVSAGIRFWRTTT